MRAAPGKRYWFSSCVRLSRKRPTMRLRASQKANVARSIESRPLCRRGGRSLSTIGLGTLRVRASARSCGRFNASEQKQHLSPVRRRQARFVARMQRAVLTVCRVPWKGDMSSVDGRVDHGSSPFRQNQAFSITHVAHRSPQRSVQLVDRSGPLGRPRRQSHTSFGRAETQKPAAFWLSGFHEILATSSPSQFLRGLWYRSSTFAGDPGDANCLWQSYPGRTRVIRRHGHYRTIR